MWHCLERQVSTTFRLISKLEYMDIQTLYKKYNYPSKQKLYTLAKLEGVKLKLKEIDSFLSEQYAQQIYSKKAPQKRGHIVSFLPDSRFQMDLIDMSNFSRTNGGFKWILMMVDIFNRKLYAYLLKNKTKDSILSALTDFFERHQPEIIISDNDPSFNSYLIKKLFNKHDSKNFMVEPNDHKALGLIDRAIQTIKNVIYKFMKQENTTTYFKELPRILDAYNNTPHSGILNIAPNEVENDRNNMDRLQILNHKNDYENRKNRIIFEVGDTVRIKVSKSAFSRSFDENYTDKQFTIVSIDKSWATLNDGSVFSVRRLIKTEPITKPVKTKDKLTEAKKITKGIKKLRKEDLKIDNKEFKNLPRTKMRKKKKIDGVRTARR